jgi:hypothetical protein
LPRHVGALFDAAQLSTTDGEAYFYKTIIEAQMDSLRRAVFYIPAEPLESVFPYPSFALPRQHLLTPELEPC